MLAKVLRVHWHDKQPVFAVDFDPNDPTKVITAGGDNNIRVSLQLALYYLTFLTKKVWRLNFDSLGEGGDVVPEYCATLSRHLKPVNCVRYSPNGEMVASAGDGGFIILWRQSEKPIVHNQAIFGGISDDDDDDDGSDEVANDNKEYWTPSLMLRASDLEDIYDICWSPDGKFLLVGLTDNTAQVWDISIQKCIRVLRDHQHFIQGVAWDPFGKFLVTESSDRSVKIWTIKVKSKGSLSISPLNRLMKLSHQTDIEKSITLFHDETLVTFFRRPCFSPDGSLLFLPAGIYKEEGLLNENCFYIMSRGHLSSLPISRIGGFERPVLGIKCNQRLFRPIPTEISLFNFNYRMIYAIFTMDTVYIFDTRQKLPIASFKDLHYGSLTDLSWSSDGYSLFVTATDGFCSIIKFSSDDLGEVLTNEDQEQIIDEIKERLGLHKAITPQTLIEHEPTSKLNSDFMEIDPPLENKEIQLNSNSNNGGGVGGEGHEADETLKPVNVLPSTMIKRRIQPTLLN